MGWLTWMLSPVGRWVSGAGAVLAAFVTVYLRGRSDAADRMRRLQAEDANRRLRDALQADDGVRRDIAAGRLREDDGHRRD
jgi:hypothetical protein